MKILYITPDITNSGGIARVISIKTDYLIDKLHFEVFVLTVNNSSEDFFYEFNSKIKWSKINQAKNKALFLWRYLRLIRKTISQTNPDVIVICDAISWVFIPWIITTKIPIIFETHVSVYLKKILNKGLLSTVKFRIISFLKKRTSKKFDKFIVLTEEAGKEWSNIIYKVIPNPNSFPFSNLATLENKKAIAVCRHSYEKGLDRLLLIWKKVTENHPDWCLDIYGEWDSDLKYQKMAENLEISKKVNFIEPFADIQKAYQDSSIFLMTSRSESFPMVLLEAITSGLPCIAYDCPNGPKSIIKNNENGFLIENGNRNLFVEKLELLMNDKNLRIELGKKAVKSAEQYKIETIMTVWHVLFQDLKKK